MSRVVGFLSVVLVLTALSGCAGDDPKTKENEHEGHTEGTMEHEGNGTANESHLMSHIVVSIDGNETTPVNGTIEADVGQNLTFDGSTSMGDNLTFAWDFGDNGTSTNESAVHAFEAPGEYNVTLTVSSGNESAESSVLVNVTSAAPAGGVVWMQTESFEGTLAVGNPNAAFQANTDYRDHPVTIAGVDENGTAVMAKRARWTLDGSGPANIEMTLYWRSGGSNLASSATQTTADEAIVFEEDMPPGEYVIRVRLNAGVNAAYTVTGEIDYEAV